MRSRCVFGKMAVIFIPFPKLCLHLVYHSASLCNSKFEYTLPQFRIMRKYTKELSVWKSTIESFPVFHSESLFLRAKSRRRMYGRRSKLAQGSIFVVLSSADLDVFENTTPMPNTIDATSSLLKNLPPSPPRAHTSIFKNAETFFQSWKSIIDAENFSSKNIQSLKSLNE